jgi:GH35 family endo-1,4-beta-xylanase
MAVDDLIKQNRTADATVTVTSRGVPVANRQVVVAQTNHKFLFGSTGFGFIPLAAGELTGAELERAELHASEWLALFNFATLPFYWGRFEPERGKPDTKRVLAAATWFAEKGVAVKGHPLCWHTVQPDWLLPLSNADILAAQEGRIVREVTDFRGVIDTWDAINEAVIMPVFENGENGITRICWQNGRVATVRMAFETARQANPKAFLLLNDFDMSSAFECLIEAVLEAGIKIDAIGLPSYEALLALVKGEWWLKPTTMTTDAQGRLRFSGFLGEYAIVDGDRRAAFKLDSKGAASVEATLPA